MMFKESSESGLSTMGFITVLAAISISVIGTITFNIKDAEAKVDRSVEFDLKNIANYINTKVSSETPSPETLIDNLYIGTDDNGVPISNNSPLTKGTIMTADGSPDGYCLFSSNPGGNLSKKTRFIYASSDGGFHILADGQTCDKGIIKTLVSDQ